MSIYMVTYHTKEDVWFCDVAWRDENSIPKSLIRSLKRANPITSPDYLQVFVEAESKALASSIGGALITKHINERHKANLPSPVRQLVRYRG